MKGFPFAEPTWPGGVEKPRAEERLGVAYDTAWARRYPARFARVLLTELVIKPAARVIADPQVDGLDRIEHLKGPVIFAANHASHLDTPLMMSAIPDRWSNKLVVAGAADYFFDSKPKAAFFALTLNATPIERNRVHRASAKALGKLLEEGWSLLIFPEGGRSPDGWAQPHKPGPAWLAVRTGRPIVPVHIEGTRQVLPRGERRIRPGRTQVSFGRPVMPGVTDARHLAEQLEGAIAQLADEQSSDWWSSYRRRAADQTPLLTGPADAGAWRRTWALGDDGRRRKRDSRATPWQKR